MEKFVNKDALNEQIHAGRRQKLRDRLATNGLSTFNECEVLEFALGYCIPRQDTNPAAHALINRFGNLPAVLAATPTDLAKVFGVGENAALFLHFLQELTTYLAKTELKEQRIIGPQDAIQYLTPLMKTYNTEQFLVISLDTAGHIKSINTITNNSLDKVNVGIRTVINYLTGNNAAQALIAHNHLNGNPLPSIPDMTLTRRLTAVLQTLDIEFLDHIIFAGDKTYSFVSSGIMDIFKKDSKHKLLD